MRRENEITKSDTVDGSFSNKRQWPETVPINRIVRHYIRFFTWSFGFRWLLLSRIRSANKLLQLINYLVFLPFPVCFLSHRQLNFFLSPLLLSPIPQLLRSTFVLPIYLFLPSPFLLCLTFFFLTFFLLPPLFQSHPPFRFFIFILFSFPLLPSSPLPLLHSPLLPHFSIYFLGLVLLYIYFMLLGSVANITLYEKSNAWYCCTKDGCRLGFTPSYLVFYFFVLQAWSNG